MTTRSPPAVHLQEKDTIAIEDLSQDGDDERVLTDPKPTSPSTNGYEAHEDVKEHSPDVDSLYEELLDDVEPFRYSEGPDICTPKEAQAYRERLHEVGASQFVRETITAGTITAKKLCTAFGVRPPIWLQDQPDSAHYHLLGLAIARELDKRCRLPQYRSLDDAVRLLQLSKNIMVITGAGISTSLGIPDFRSKHTGFYSKLREAGFSEPEQVFDLKNFDEDPNTFYALAGDILPDLQKWTPTHQFIRLLQDKDKLLRNYTQNIDNVESNAGISPNRLVQCHGSWATATCRKCGYRVHGHWIFDDIRAHRVAQCKQCILQLQLKPQSGLKRKRAANGHSKKKRRDESDDDESDGEYDIPQPGVMKPDITFFGEPLPQKFFETLQKHDRDAVDLVIVIGTSMKVAPVSEVPQIIPPKVPQIYISRDPVHHIDFDINLLGDCDTIVAELCRRAGWDLQHEMLPVEQKIDVQRHEDQEYTTFVRARSP